jgi:imidazolonepropionase-like amidohydrolase
MGRVALGFLSLLAVVAASSGQGIRPAAGAAVLYEGARLIAGDGTAPIENAAFLVEGGTITRVGTKGAVTRSGAVRVDLAGKTVMPTLFGAHGHPGFQKGLTYVRENYTRETYIDDLHRAAYYGVGAMLAQGIDPGDLPFQIRAEQQAGRLGGARLFTAGRGIGAPDAGPGAEAYRGIAYEVTTPEEGRACVRAMVAKKADVIKIWVDDRNGRAPRMPPPVFHAIIDEAHAHGVRVNAHVFYLSDARELVEAGVDAFAHLVRDHEMDDALVAAIVRRNVYVMPNLGAAERTTHAGPPPWLASWLTGPLLLADTVSANVIQRMKDARREPADADASRTRYAILQRSLAKLNAAGARIILGSDTGLPDHFFGFAEQRELQLMVDAGMTPAQVIVAATSRPAEYLRLENMGTLASGKSADFLVLDANPLDDIAHTRRIAKVYLRGQELDRAALRSRWSSGVTYEARRE